MTALAQPALMMIDLMPLPFRRVRMSRETCTGAAWNLLAVKTAAAVAGVSEVMNARSAFRVFEGLTPTCVADTRKPLGYVPDVGTNFTLADGIDESIGAE